MRPDLQEFAKTLIAHVRDRAIQSADSDLKPHAESPVARRWRSAGVQQGNVVIPDVVDETIFALLNAIDQGLLPLTFSPKDGAPINLAEVGLGELGGWFMGNGGWRTQYSNERFTDDFADMCDPVNTQLATELTEIIRQVASGATFDVAHGSNVGHCLELAVPRALQQRYPEWTHESLDGVFVARATRTASDVVELVGKCILMSDQTVTPFAVELRLASVHAIVSRVRLGQPGAGALGVSGPACNTKQAAQLLHTVAHAFDAIDWQYTYNAHA